MPNDQHNQPTTKGDLESLRKELTGGMQTLRKNLTVEMQVLKQDVQVLKKDVQTFRQTLPGIVEGVIAERTEGLATREDLAQWKDEILVSNDRVIRKLDDLTTEKVFMGSQIDRHERKIESLETFANKVSVKTNVSFQAVE